MIKCYLWQHIQNQIAMREYTKKTESQSRTLDSNPEASRQAPIDVILQRYKERNIQRYTPEEDKELIQGKLDTTQREEIDEEEFLQRKVESDNLTQQAPIQREEKPNNTGLLDNLKSGIENLSGYSMDDVRVHYNSSKPAQLQALAYTQDADIYVAPGQERHLPHEAWHVVQQKQGRVQPTMQLQGVNVNDNEGLEKEADVMGVISMEVYQEKSSTKQFSDSRIEKNAVLQGKFGFEMELGLGLGWSNNDDETQDKSNYSCPDNKIIKPLAAKGDGFDVHLDHNSKINVVDGGSAIVELVTTPPIDESTATEADVRGRMNQMVGFVNDAKSKTSSLSKRAMLRNIQGVTSINTTDGFLFVGDNEKGEQQLDTGYMQSTYAVKIEKMPEVFSHISRPENNINPVSREIASYVSEICSNPSKFMEDINLINMIISMDVWEIDTRGDTKETSVYRLKETPDIKAEFKDIETKTGELILPTLPPLMGYLSLILNYLLLGQFVQKHPKNSLRKNHLGLIYYKSRLSSMRNDLPEDSRCYLEDDSIRLEISFWLQEKSRIKNVFEDVQQKAFPSDNELSQTTVYYWLNSILEGKSDPLFDASKNRYGEEIEEIEPYPVGKADEQSVGIVIENRKVAPLGGFRYKEAVEEKDKYKELADGIDQSQRNVSDWEEIAVGIWKYLRSVNGIE